MKKLFLLISFSTLNFQLSTFNAFAACSQTAAFNIGDCFSPASAGKINTVGDLATIALTVLISLAGILSIFFIIFAGIKFITGAGDEKKMQNAKDTITYAIIGLVVTALAFVILQIVQYLIGSKVPI